MAQSELPMNEMDDNPWDWVWARLTGQDEPANSSQTPAPVAFGENFSDPSNRFELPGTDVGPLPCRQYAHTARRR